MKDDYGTVDPFLPPPPSDKKKKKTGRQAQEVPDFQAVTTSDFVLEEQLRDYLGAMEAEG